jgi:hypothetical protein
VSLSRATSAGHSARRLWLQPQSAMVGPGCAEGPRIAPLRLRSRCGALAPPARGLVSRAGSAGEFALEGPPAESAACRRDAEWPRREKSGSWRTRQLVFLRGYGPLVAAQARGRMAAFLSVAPPAQGHQQPGLEHLPGLRDGWGAAPGQFPRAPWLGRRWRQVGLHRPHLAYNRSPWGGGCVFRESQPAGWSAWPTFQVGRFLEIERPPSGKLNAP